MSKKPVSAKNIIHPKITSIQNHINFTNEYFRKKNYLEALNEMDLTTMELFPEDQPENIINEIKKQIKREEGIVYKGIKDKWLKENVFTYKNIFRDLQKHIAECGYWSLEKYGRSFTPASEMPTANPKPEIKRYPARLTSDLEDEEE